MNEARHANASCSFAPGRDVHHSSRVTWACIQVRLALRCTALRASFLPGPRRRHSEHDQVPRSKEGSAGYGGEVWERKTGVEVGRLRELDATRKPVLTRALVQIAEGDGSLLQFTCIRCWRVFRWRQARRGLWKLAQNGGIQGEHICSHHRCPTLTMLCSV